MVKAHHGRSDLVVSVKKTEEQRRSSVSYCDERKKIWRRRRSGLAFVVFGLRDNVAAWVSKCELPMPPGLAGRPDDSKCCASLEGLLHGESCDGDMYIYV